MSFTNGQMLQAIGPNQCQSITASALGTLLSGLVTPAAHATTHKSGGSDAIKLDELAAPTDVTTLNVSTSAHGLCPKAPNSTSQVLRGDGTFGTPVVFTGDSGSGGAVGAVPAPAAGDAAASKFLGADGTWKVAGAGTVTSVTGTAPIVSSGGTTPAISINDATATVRGAVPTPPNDTTKFLRGDATWGTPPGTGVTSVSGTSPISSSGGTTPAISIADATATARGAVPTPPNDTSKFLRGDATWAAPGGVSSVTGTAPIASSGGTTPAISIGAFATGQLQVTAGPTVQVFASTGTWTCPAYVTAVQVECWGAGGGGGAGKNSAIRGGGGGGGGAYSKSTAISVVPGTVYTVTVGTGGAGGASDGADGTDGGDSWFSTTGTILAKGGTKGLGSLSGTGGAGGAAGSGVGTIKNSGGTGANNVTTNGGGGGSSAGTAASGNNGSGQTAGSAPTGGGAGGNGGNTAAAGQNASTPGGGGGGGGQVGIGGAGANGQVIVTIVQETLTLNTAVGGATTTPTLTLPPVTGTVITNQDVQTIPGQSLAASALALILMRVCRGA